jgi:hypothetical protein
MKHLRPRETPAPVIQIMQQRMSEATRVLDVSLPADRISTSRGRPVAYDDSASPALPGALAGVKADVVVSLGASVGACRSPEDFVLDLWGATDRKGLLLVELPESVATERTFIDRVRDARRSVPEKVAALLGRHPEWCSAHALHAVGGAALLNPLDSDRAADALRRAGASRVKIHRARADTVLLEAGV